MVMRMRKKQFLEQATIIVLFLYLAGFAMYYDLSVFINWVYAAQELGVTRIYDAKEVFGFDYRVVYPPLSPTIFIANYVLAQSVVNQLEDRVLVVNSLVGSNVSPLLQYLERLLVKMPIIIASLILWRMFKQRYGTKAAIVFAMGPPLLIVLTVYNFDLLMVLFLFLSITLLASGRYKLAAVSLAVSTLFKQIAILAYIPIALWLLRWRGLVVTTKYTIAYIGTLTIVLMPFIVVGGLDTIVNSILGFHEARPPQGPTIVSSLYYLVWSFDSSNPLLNTILFSWPIVFVALLAVLFLKTKFRRDASSLEDLVAMVFTAYLVVGKVVNPVYTLWAYPFIVSAAFRYGRLQLVKSYIGLTLLVLTYFFLMYTSAYAVGGSVFLPEENRWIHYNELILHLYASFGPYSTLVDMYLSLIHLPLIRDIFTLIYDNWWLTATILSIAYTVQAIKVLYKLVNLHNNR